jgi:hypothetical protein
VTKKVVGVFEFSCASSYTSKQGSNVKLQPFFEHRKWLRPLSLKKTKKPNTIYQFGKSSSTAEPPTPDTINVLASLLATN